MNENLMEITELVAHAVVVLGALGGGSVVLLTQVLPWLSERRSKRMLQRRLGLENYSDQQIASALRYYVHPNCQQTDPSGHEENRALGLVQEPLFRSLSRELNNTSAVRHIIILADSGMGKTSAVLNFCALHLRSRGRRSYGVHVVHLGSPNVEELIRKAQAPERTILFLDALDEDTKAVEDHHRRIADLLRLSSSFRSVIVTCRTQFFTRDEEIPRETGIMKSAPRRAGEGGEYLFHKLYLSPFSDVQVSEYLRRRYSLWKWAKRRQAHHIVSQMTPLALRPMLLAHIDDLLLKERSYSRAVDIYEEMVDAWIHREEGFVSDPAELLRFSKLLAVELYLHRERRGSEWISVDELQALAQKWRVSLARHTLTGRSLLNRDAVGNYKFAHRSIMEYLYVQGFWEGNQHCAVAPWTDQMWLFLEEHLRKSDLSDRNRVATLLERGSSFHAQLIANGLQQHGPTRWSVGSFLQKWLFDGLDEEKKGRVFFTSADRFELLSVPPPYCLIAVHGFLEKNRILIIQSRDNVREVVFQRTIELCSQVGMKNLSSRGELWRVSIIGDPS